ARHAAGAARDAAQSVRRHHGGSAVPGRCAEDPHRHRAAVRRKGAGRCGEALFDAELSGRARPRGDPALSAPGQTAMIELYHHGSSVCARKVRLALGEKGLAWKGHSGDLSTGEQFKPEYVKLNPKAVVPTLVHDGQVILE